MSEVSGLNIGRGKHPDFMLLHPPSVYDFRKLPSIPGPISDLIPSGPFFEMYPIGFSYLAEYLGRYGISTRVVNLAARMAEKKRFDVERFIRRSSPGAYGIGFHWLPHCHGALEMARICKREHPATPTIMGGYSASLYHRELLDYPFVDYVLRGDSTEEPARMLLSALDSGGDLSGVPNLTWRGPGGIRSNPCSYVPGDLDYLGRNYDFMVRSTAGFLDRWGFKPFKGWWSYPMTAVLTCRGCLGKCTFCGGSRWSAEKCFCRPEPAFRSPENVAGDIESASRITGAPVFVIGDIRQPGDEYANRLLDALKEISPTNHIVLELFEPPPEGFFNRVAECLINFNFQISPESHDERVRAAAGKEYTNSDLERAVGTALEAGCSKFDVFFMIGLPFQTPESVMDTVSYCGRLLSRHGTRLNPLIGPLAPFLDPGSIAHADPDRLGYRLLFDSLEEYRRALLSFHWRQFLNYETRWMSRQQIVDSTYRAMLELNRLKRDSGKITIDYANQVEDLLMENTSLLERYDKLSGEGALTGSRLALLKREAGSLRNRSALLKRELEWPVVGRRFHYLRIANIIAGARRHSRFTEKPKEPSS